MHPDLSLKKLALLALLFSLVLPWQVFAQGEYQAVVSKPDTSQFPIVSTTLNIHQPDGGFIHGLDRDLVRHSGRRKSIQVDSIQEIRIGMQISVVINAGPGFSSRNSKGISRFDTLKQFLEAWAEDQKEIGIDDLSLFSNSGISQSHLSNSQAWLTALATYQPDFKKSVPGLGELGTAIQTAQDTTFPKPVHRAILYITALPGKEMTETVLDDLVNRAEQAQTNIFVWMLASKGDFNSPASGYLRALAGQTGGQFFAFSGSETFPEFQTLLEPLRYLYQIEYHSNIQEGGKHNLSARLDLQDQIITSTPTTFEINLQPAIPIFVGMPAAITRTSPQNSKNPILELAPSQLSVEFLVEYPDHLPRDLKEAVLLVDGQIVSKNAAEPFTHFNWDLNDYTSTSRHTLQVEITDILGISSSSNALPVQIDVTLPEASGWNRFLESNGL